MKKSHPLLLKISVLFISLTYVDVGLVNTILGDINKYFPDAGPTLVSLVATIPTLIMIPMTVISGRLCSRFSKKDILIVGLVIYILGGVGAAFLSYNIFQLIFMRVIIGIGAGLSSPLSASIISELYNEKERANLMGIANAIGGISGIALTILTGWLCVFGWRYAFFAYFIFLPILIMEILLLPKTPPASVLEETSSRSEAKESLSSIKTQIAVLSISTMMVLFLGYIIMIKVAIYVTNEGIGNSQTVANIMAGYAISTIVGGMMFGRIYDKMKRFTITLSMVLCALGYFIMLIAHSPFIVAIAIFVSGMGGSIFMPYTTLRASLIGPKKMQALIISIVLDSLFLGQFLGTFVEAGINKLFNNPSISFLFKFCGIGFIIYAVITVVWIKSHPDRIREESITTSN